MSKPLRFVCYAYDLGPGRNVMMVAGAALAAGHRLPFAAANDQLDRIEPPADAIVTGLSSYKNEVELWLGRWALQLGVPWIIVADTHRSWARPAAKGKIENALLLVASPIEKEEAIRFGYNRVEYVGGPPLWQEFRATVAPRLARDQGEVYVLVGGIKDAKLTDAMLAEAVAACKMTIGRDRLRVIFKPHGNEDPSSKNEARRAEALSEVTVFDSKAHQTELVRAVDVSIFTSGATDTIAAAHMRRPVIYFENAAVRTRMEKQTGEPTWYPTEAGACVKAGHAGEIANALRVLLFPRGSEPLGRKQAEIYPERAGDPVERRIIQFIESLAK